MMSDYGTVDDRSQLKLPNIQQRWMTNHHAVNTEIKQSLPRRNSYYM